MKYILEAFINFLKTFNDKRTHVYTVLAILGFILFMLILSIPPIATAFGWVVGILFFSIFGIFLYMAVYKFIEDKNSDD